MDHMRMHQKKRTANFREDETKLLIQLWGSPNIQNKLFLTHRKAPVMRLLAAHMQQRGFYRTPDEIKTRIRNLKCLYHRIKRTMACGQGIGTVDPDWPHFKAMDEILSKESPRKDVEKIMEEALDGPKIEDVVIKQEVEDIDIDDNDSWVTNESVNSDYEDDNPPPPLKPAPAVIQNVSGKASFSQAKLPLPPTSSAISTSTTQKLPTILPAFSLPGTQIAAQTPANKSLPFPLLILNNLQPQPQHQQQQINKNTGNHVLQTQNGNVTNKVTNSNDEDFSDAIKELLKVQKESLVIQKEKLEIEKQRLEFNRLIGTQMMTLLPMLGGLLQRLAYTNTEELLDIKVEPGEESCGEVGVKRKRENNDDILKDCKILRNMLEQGIKKYMMIGEESTKDSSDNDENCMQHDEQSNFSDKSGDK